MTYSELRAALNAYMARTDPEAVGNEDTALELARVKLNRDFHPELAMTLAESIPLAEGIAALPADFAASETVSTAGGDLVYATPREFTRLAGRGETAGQFTVTGGILHCDGAVTEVALLYFRAAEPVEGEEENWLCESYPDVWLWQAIAEQHRFVQDWESAMAADSYAANLAAQAAVQSKANKAAGGSLRMVTRR